MDYRIAGKSGVRLSALGFGCMRLPMRDEKTVDRDLAIPLLVRGYKRGINYFDTGKWYCAQDSERTLGEALRHMDRSRVLVSTKYAFEKPTAADLREKFETSLKLLGLEYVDYYHLWGIGWEFFRSKLSIPGGPLQEFLKLKDEGLVRHLAFSFHSEPQDIPKLVDTGYFESMLCQYNLLDRKCEAGISYAASKGLGVMVMGPVGGGRLASRSEVIDRMAPGGAAPDTPALALRFVLANPSVTVALSGMSTLEQVEQNAATVSRDEPLAAGELACIRSAAEENQKFMDLYCMPCPQEVNIPHIFAAMNLRTVWGLPGPAAKLYAEIGTNPWVKGKRADACTECGQCEEKCPQKIPIIEQVRQSRAALEKG